MSPRTLAWTAGAVVTVVLLAALGWGLAHPKNVGSGQILGRAAPQIVIRTMSGQTVNLDGLRGRPVVLNFWASWCVACRTEDPILSRLARQIGSRVAFLGVDIQDTPGAAQAYEADQQAPYPVGPALGGVPKLYGVDAPPQTFFINPGGVVVARFMGPIDPVSLSRYLNLTGA
ncbi:MAG: TlpA family protein disulfide reductase [Candidatus Dormibacteraceae bacterium]